MYALLMNRKQSEKRRRIVRRYVEEEGEANLREQLKERYLSNADRSLEIAEYWFHLEDEAWRNRRS